MLKNIAIALALFRLITANVNISVDISSISSASSDSRASSDKDVTAGCPPEVRCKDQPSRIVGGCQVEPHTFPWQVQIKFKGRFISGGTILCPTLVLTGAHCVESCPKNAECKIGSCTIGPTSDIDVLVGKHSFLGEGDGIKHQVKRVLVHPDYPRMPWNENKKCEGATFYDFAALVLTQKIKLGTGKGSIAAAVYLPKPSDGFLGVFPKGTHLVASGWGNTQSEPICIPEALNAVTLDPMSTVACLKLLRGLIDGYAMCAASPHKGSCHGDSGGPLVFLDQKSKKKKVKLIGVTSNALRPCGKYPSVYRKVSSIIQEKKDWIDSTGKGWDVVKEMKKCNAKTCKKGLLKKGKCITAKTLDPDVKRHFFD